MQVLRATAKYELVEDRLMGVVRFDRIADGGVSLMMTGCEAQSYKDTVLALSDDDFDDEAETFEYF